MLDHLPFVLTVAVNRTSLAIRCDVAALADVFWRIKEEFAGRVGIAQEQIRAGNLHVDDGLAVSFVASGE